MGGVGSGWSPRAELIPPTPYRVFLCLSQLRTYILGGELFCSGIQVSFQVKCSNGSCSNLWLILYTMKTKLFSIALMMFPYRDGGGAHNGEERDTKAWKGFDPYHYHLLSRLPSPTTLFPLFLLTSLCPACSPVNVGRGEKVRVRNVLEMAQRGRMPRPVPRLTRSPARVSFQRARCTLANHSYLVSNPTSFSLSSDKKQFLEIELVFHLNRM